MTAGDHHEFLPLPRQGGLGTGLKRRHLDRKTPWRLVKKYCRAAGIDPDRLGGRDIGIHSLRKTAINDAIRNGASMHEVREFAGHADIRTTEVWTTRRRPFTCTTGSCPRGECRRRRAPDGGQPLGRWPVAGKISRESASNR